MSDFEINFKINHEYWMQYALELAQYASDKGEVPIGAVLVQKNQVIGEGWNRPVSYNDPTAHAEIIALRQGGLALQNYRLLKCTLYVTLEPCIMCFGAMMHGRIDTLVYGAHNKTTGATSLLINTSGYSKMNHKICIISGILAPICSDILKVFFRIRRLQKKKLK